MLQELFGLEGKTALVTGASSGLGRQMSKALAHAGASVIAIARNKQRLEELSNYIEQIGRQVKTYSIDLSNHAEIKGLIDILNRDKINIDILVNNAGITKLTSVTEDCLDLWDHQININLKAVWQLSQAIANQMINNNISGSIINISSINGANSPYAGASAYGATKAAVIQLSRVLSGELSKHMIRVNTIIPGLFYTESTAKVIDDNTDKATDIRQQIPLRFIAEPKDLDGLVLYLASNNASRYVTGSEFVIDGGISANCKGI